MSLFDRSGEYVNKLKNNEPKEPRNEQNLPDNESRPIKKKTLQNITRMLLLMGMLATSPAGSGARNVLYDKLFGTGNNGDKSGQNPGELGKINDDLKEISGVSNVDFIGFEQFAEGKFTAYDGLTQLSQQLSQLRDQLSPLQSSQEVNVSLDPQTGELAHSTDPNTGETMEGPYSTHGNVEATIGTIDSLQEYIKQIQLLSGTLFDHVGTESYFTALENPDSNQLAQLSEQEKEIYSAVQEQAREALSKSSNYEDAINAFTEQLLASGKIDSAGMALIKARFDHPTNGSDFGGFQDNGGNYDWLSLPDSPSHYGEKSKLVIQNIFTSYAIVAVFQHLSDSLVVGSGDLQGVNRTELMAKLNSSLVDMLQNNDATHLWLEMRRDVLLQQASQAGEASQQSRQQAEKIAQLLMWLDGLALAFSVYTEVKKQHKDELKKIHLASDPYDKSKHEQTVHLSEDGEMILDEDNSMLEQVRKTEQRRKRTAEANAILDAMSDEELTALLRNSDSNQLMTKGNNNH